MRILKKIGTRLYQHGFSYEHMIRMGKHQYPNVIANSIPKAGTNLVLRALVLISPYHRPLVPTITEHNAEKYLHKCQRSHNLVFPAHLDYQNFSSLWSNDWGSVKNIFVIRDPRDVVLSHVWYLRKDKKHRLYKYFKTLTTEQAIQACIDGVSSTKLSGQAPSLSIKDTYDRFSPWIDSDAHVVRFEELIGTHGGGDDVQQLDALTSLSEYLGISLAEEEIANVAAQVFNEGSRTFHKGVIGRWREELLDEDVERISEKLGVLMQKYGYAD